MLFLYFVPQITNLKADYTRKVKQKEILRLETYIYKRL